MPDDDPYEYMESHEFSIFRIPESILNGYEKDFHPESVSIGPFHHGSEHVKTMEEQKQHYRQSFDERYVQVPTDESQTQSLLSSIRAETLSTVRRAKNHYCGDIDLDDYDFYQMLVSDGCFSIDIFTRNGEMASGPSFISSRINKHSIKRDLVKLENQLPLFLLESYFCIVKRDQERTSLQVLALDCFRDELKWIREFSGESSQSFPNLGGVHLLDLLRLSFVISAPKEPLVANQSAKFIECATKLWEAGIRFRSVAGDSCFLNINFKTELNFTRGVLEIPKVVMDPFTACFIRNCIAFEHCHGHSSKHFTAYAIFMGCLIRSEKDLQVLCDNGIILNRYGRDEDLVKYFIELGRDVDINWGTLYLSKQLGDVNSYYENSFYMRWSRFKNGGCYHLVSIPLVSAVIMWILKFIADHFQSIFAEKIKKRS